MKLPNGTDNGPGSLEAKEEVERAPEVAPDAAARTPIPTAQDDRRRCIWCAMELPDYDDSGLPFSPSVCVACAEYLAADERLSLQDFIEGLPHPVLLVNSDCMVSAANQEARTLLGKGTEEIAGRSGGDVIECSSARLPGGCGNTIHCKGCALRRSVEHTYQTGESLDNVVAHQSVMSELGIRRVWYRIATERVTQMVLVRIDDVGIEREA